LERRRRLQIRIEKFHAEARSYMTIPESAEDDFGSQDLEDPASDSEDDGSSVGLFEDDESTDDDGGIEEPTDAISTEAEHAMLMLPSSFGSEAAIEGGFGFQAEQELELRVGQANDALHELRVQLGYKAFLFRTSIRNANSQKKKTRAFATKSSIEALVRVQYRRYLAARKAMIRLGASAEILVRYQKLTADQLKIGTAAHDPSIHGQRNSTLPWFWTMDVDVSAAENDWMSECTYFTYLQDKSLPDHH
jgi:hypothetical protein